MIEINRLKYPYTKEQRLFFIVENNHKNGYLIQIDPETSDLLALAKDNEELKAIDKENIGHLNMTRLDFINGLETLGIGWSAIKALIAANSEVDKQLTMCSNVWRGNPLLDQMIEVVNQTLKLSITPTDLDEIFIQKCGYTRLAREDVIEEETPTDVVEETPAETVEGEDNA